MIIEEKGDYFDIAAKYLGTYYEIVRKEQRVLSVLMKFRYANRYHHRVDDFINNADVKKKLRGIINISEPSFNNSLSTLRKKGLLIDNKLLPLLTNIKQGEELKIHVT